MRTARARTSVEKRFPGFPLVIAYLPSFLLSGKPGLVHLPTDRQNRGELRIALMNHFNALGTAEIIRVA